MMPPTAAKKVLLRRFDYLAFKAQEWERQSNVPSGPCRVEMGAIRRALYSMGTPHEELPAMPLHGWLPEAIEQANQTWSMS